MSNRRKTLIALVMVPVVIMLTLASVGIASAHPSGKPAGHPVVLLHKKPKITISMLAFTVPASVKPGAKITIVNKDGFLHSVTSDDGTSFTTDAPADSKVTMTAPMTPGSYPFHCRIHTFMMATLVVKNK